MFAVAGKAVHRVSLVGALLAAVCFGAASVLQAQAARTEPTRAEIDPRLLARLLRNWRFLVGTGLDLLGFLFELAALRTLPLFLVQAAVAASLAVTALLAARLLHERLGPAEWAGVAAVCVGLALLGLSAGREGGKDPGGWFDIALAALLVVLALTAAVAVRANEPVRAVVLGSCAGLAFGVVALSARTLTNLAPTHLLREPSFYLLAAGGGLGYLLFTTALQRGSVTVATAAMVIGETAAPAGVGILVLGDSARNGLGPVAVFGFVLAVAGALSLARFGELKPEPA
jgi:drug/metabolite transporter (DMT)-like permease